MQNKECTCNCEQCRNGQCDQCSCENCSCSAVTVNKKSFLWKDFLDFMNTIAIWNLYAIDVERFILSKVQDECVSKDLLQEVFLRVHVNKHRLKESDKVKSWLFSIARNIVVDYYRKKRVLQVVDQMEVTEEPLINQVHTEVECFKGNYNVCLLNIR